ncbi:hypothetical protein [Arcobacter peruensis]|uniref:hypothetical protein n=1 Tax=Arcobacter peruensis TaxID=2320140 RepID=UPI000F07E7B7|nr:hypothetical protein [Arcobacter peruensis]
MNNYNQKNKSNRIFEFEELDKSLQKQIIDICKDDPYNLNPKSLYKNILNSSGNLQTLSKMFEVPELLIIKIKEGKTNDN